MRGAVGVAAFALILLSPAVAHADSPRAPWEISVSLGEQPRLGNEFDLNVRLKAHAAVAGMTLLVRAPPTFVLDPPHARDVDMESGAVREYTWRVTITEPAIWHVEAVLAGGGASVRAHVFGAAAAGTGLQAPTIEELWGQMDLSLSLRAVPLADRRVELQAQVRPLDPWMGLGRLHADLRTSNDLAQFEAPGDKILDYNLTVEVPDGVRTRAWTQVTFAANVSEADGPVQARRDAGCRHLYLDPRSDGDLRAQESIDCDYKPVSVPGPTGGWSGALLVAAVLGRRLRRS